MSAPAVCTLCGTAHHAHRAHVFSREPSRVTEKKPAAPAAKALPVLSSIASAVKHEGAVELGRRGGLVGGVVRASRLTPERRQEIAQAAARARWAK